MLSNFIRRNGKRKGNKAIESRSHQNSFSASAPSLASPLVFDINEESLALAQSQSPPLAELNLLDSNEEWFPQELLRNRSCSPGSSRHAQNAMVTQNNLTQENHANPSPAPSLNHSEDVSPVSVSRTLTASSRHLILTFSSKCVTFRKKSIPAPIIIPDADLMPKLQMAHLAVPTRASSQTEANDAPSPSVSDSLSSISGTTIARALIASSFVLSSCECRSSQRRSGLVRHDSATLPCGSFFLSDSRSSSPIPPVPPVPAMLVGVPDPNHPSTIKSGASTDSEYPTSPETAISSVIPQRTFCVQEISSPTVPPVVPDMTPQRKASPRNVGLVPRIQVANNVVFDGPKTAIEVPLPIHSQETTRHSSQEGSSFLLSSDDHSLDEFDFAPASPASESSASYIAPIASIPKRSDTNRGQRKRRVGGANLVWNGCMAGSLSHSQFESENFFTAKDVSLTGDILISHQAHGLPSATMSEYDYGELLNHDLPVNPGSSTGSSHICSSASTGCQTFPETPIIYSPLWSPEYTFAKPDSKVPRRHLSSLKSTGRGPGKLHSSIKAARRRVGIKDGIGGAAMLRRSRSSLLPRQKTPSPRQAWLNLPPSAQVNDDVGIPDETNQSLTKSAVESQDSVGLLSADRAHPLANISASSSYLLEEEGLLALARDSSLFLPPTAIDDINPSPDPITVPVSVTDPSVGSPTSVPLPESTDVSPFNSPALADNSTMVSPSTSLPQSPLPTTSTAISQFHASKSPLSPPSSFLTSFLPSPSPSASSYASPSPSFVPPPPYSAVVSEKTAYHPGSTSPRSFSPTAPGHQPSRQPSHSSLTSVSMRNRVRSRPPLPIGPRKPSGPGQVFGSFFPGIRGRNGSASSLGSSDSTVGPGLPWRKLHAAASKPPPKFQPPPSKWRGLTLEAAQWTFTSAQLHEIVSQAIHQSSEGSSLRFLRPDILEGEIADEMHRLELQHTDVKAQYKALVRRRWMLMGALAGHVESVTNDATTAARTVEELAEVLSALDCLADKIHDIVFQMAQLKSLRDVHNTSALAMALRKINGLFVREMAEKERLQEQIDALQTERDEAWKHAEDIAQDYDTLNDRVSESAGGCGDTRVNADALSLVSSKRSTRISAVRKSSVRLSQAGLRFRSKHRPGRSSGVATRPTSLALDDIPPVPRLPANSSMRSSALPPSTGMPCVLSDASYFNS